MNLKPGSRYKSTVCPAEVIVIRANGTDGVLECGGVAMAAVDADLPKETIRPGYEGGCLVGKRYRLDAIGLEVLCSRGGEGALSFNGEQLMVAASRRLPSSD